uniref:Uncharacterized protein n=1 Tax=Oryza sativa subsp. japonica TaxID=39947 RepID=Q6K3W8_ORYSJ|nr:hypothetical protein [Oryza sativa Japonica Group]
MPWSSPRSTLTPSCSPPPSSASSSTSPSAPTTCPPGPSGIPVLDALPLVGPAPHADLASLERKYGPVMYLKMGTCGVVVASSPCAARAFLPVRHDEAARLLRGRAEASAAARPVVIPLPLTTPADHTNRGERDEGERRRRKIWPRRRRRRPLPRPPLPPP